MEANALNPFITASKTQLRFETERGHFATEDLWSLSLKDLDKLAVAIDEDLNKRANKSFLANPDKNAAKAAEVLELKLEILKTIITVKQDENSAAVAAASNRQQRAFLTQLKQKKAIDALESLSVDEIDAQLASLGAEE